MKVNSPAFISGITDYGQMRVQLYQSDRVIHAPLTAVRDGLMPFDADLAAFAALTGTGIPARTADNTWALRTLTAPAAGITISNPAGVAGNPTFALADDLAAVEGIATTGLALRSASNTWSTVTYTTAGTFTPTIVGSSTAGAGTYSVQTGYYAQIGPLVWFTLTIVWSAHTGTGNMNIGNIPVTPNGSHTMIFNATATNMTGSTSPNLTWTGSVFQIRNSESGAAITLDTAATFIATGVFQT